MLQVYITDLAAYNKGFLFGELTTLPMNPKELQKVVDKVLRGGEAICAIEYGYEKHEEYFITDYEWMRHEFFDIDEYHNIHDLNDTLLDLQFRSENELQAIAFLLSQGLAVDIENAIAKVDDVIIHENCTMKDLAYEILNQCYGVDRLPPIIANNIDYERVASEMEYDACYFEVGNDIYEYHA